MKYSEIIASYVGFSLVAVTILLLWLLNLSLGLAFTVFVGLVMAWYLRVKRKGDAYLREVAKRIKCKFQSGGLGYGRVIGFYKGYEVEISVNKDYDALKGLSGFILSEEILNSVIGVLAGIKNFTSIKVKHKAHVNVPFKLNRRTYIDKHLIVYLPFSDGVTGLPKCEVKSLIAKIDEIIEKAKVIERNPVSKL